MSSLDAQPSFLQSIRPACYVLAVAPARSVRIIERWKRGARPLPRCFGQRRNLFRTPGEAIGESAKRAANERCNPENPQLRQSPTVHKHGRPRAARWVYRCVRYRNTDQVYQRKTQPNGDRSEVTWCTFVRRAHDYEKEGSRHDDLAYEPGAH